jgi:hypothetical protein
MVSPEQLAFEIVLVLAAVVAMMAPAGFYVEMYEEFCTGL